ncbi:MAG: hypothetical protein KAG80_00485 [Nocardioides sp.]|nr:hypothetical protein [Nocardioides sp.]
MELVQVRRSTAWLVSQDGEPIPARDVAHHDPTACLGARVVVEDLDGALHLAQIEPVVTPEGRIDVAVRIRLRVTVSEALALGAYRDPSVQAPWESTPSLLRTFRRDRQLIVDRLEQQRGDD